MCLRRGSLAQGLPQGCPTFRLGWAALSEEEPLRATSTTAAPKVMPLNYFHGNNRHKSTITLFDRANSQLQNTLLFPITVTSISHVFSTVMNKCLHAALVTICTGRGDPLFLSPLQNSTITTSLCSHPLFGLHKCLEQMNVCGCYCFCTSMSDVILSDFPSAVICHTATTCKGPSLRRFNLCCHGTNTCL